MKSMRKVHFITTHGVKWIGYPVGSHIEDVISVSKPLAVEIKLNMNDIAQGINLWVRGSSGAILGAMVAAEIKALGINVFISHVKKDGEAAHDSCPSYDSDYQDFILDDFVDTGETVSKIVDSLKNYSRPAPYTLVTTQGRVDVSKWYEWEDDYPNFESIDKFINGGDLTGYYEV